MIEKRTDLPGIRLLLCALAVAINATLSAASAVKNPPVDYIHDIRPILAQNCFTCHGPDEKTRKAGFRLDMSVSATKPAKSGAVPVVAGDVAHSEVMRRILTKDDDDHMPPAKTGKTLKPEQVELVKRWIAEGAVWKNHWAYDKPVAAPLPVVHQKKWCRNPIDFYVLARLEKEGLHPSPEASRETLIRRLSLDLIGLPPSPSEVASFVDDRRPDAYERLVERLLASPHYGERWARLWLDLARYADSNGYEADYLRTAWPYRDWVINAFNINMPFDEFTIEQIAGDLIPNATRDQRIATGFHRNTMVNTEGGTDDEEFRVAALIDRVNTTYTVWMGTTIGCCQCHSHKYDPFSQREFYQSLAFFNQTRDRGKSLDPVLELPSEEQRRQRDEVRAKIEPLQKVLDTQTPEIQARQDLWRNRLIAARAEIESNWVSLEPLEFSASNQVTLEKLPDQSLLSKGPLPDNSAYEVTVALPAGSISALRLEALTDPGLPNGSCGRSEDGDFVVTDFTVDPPPVSGDKTNHFTHAYADYSMGGYDVGAAIDGDPQSGWSIAAYEPSNRTAHQAVFVWDQAWTASAGQKLKVRIRQDSNRAQHLLGRFRLSASAAGHDAHLAWGKLPNSIRRILASPESELDNGRKEELARHFRGIDSALDPVRNQIAELRKQEPHDIPTSLVMEAVDAERETHVMIRGSFLNPGEAVSAAVPSVLHPLPPGPTNRLTFARWLVSSANPLVGRVTMNRIWAQYFGRGIVETSEDFGVQGEPPTQPEVLDYLASEFVRRGWDIKAMHRLIVSSAAYRQESRVSPELAERDPYNRLLAHGPRFRMEAEMLRDNALAVSGLLNRQIGGKSVFPHQPEGIWSRPYSGERWDTSTDGQEFRRGLYTFWRRTSPYPSMIAFDASSREVVCERRPRSDTPVQALVTLNDPAFVAAARGLARRVLREGGPDLNSQVAFAYRCVLARRPSARESAVLARLYDQSITRFRADSRAAESLSAASKDDAASVAAWTVLANVLLNLDETLTKG